MSNTCAKNYYDINLPCFHKSLFHVQLQPIQPMLVPVLDKFDKKIRIFHLYGFISSPLFLWTFEHNLISSLWTFSFCLNERLL